MRTALLVAYASLMLVCAAPDADAATPWSGLQPVSTSVPSRAPDIRGGTYAALAVNPGGRAAAAWIGVDGTVLESRRAPDGDWTAPALITPAGTGTPGVSVAIAMDDAGDATVIWVAGTNTAPVVEASTSLAGGAYGAPVTVALPLGLASAPSVIHLAMNASGQAAVAFDENSLSQPAYAATSRSIGGIWDAVQISSSAANHAGVSSDVAINASGEAIATFLDYVGGVYTAQAVPRDAPSGGDTFFDVAKIRGLGTVDKGDATHVAIDDSGRVTAVTRTGSSVQVVTRGAGTNVAFGVAETVTSGCNNATYDFNSAIALAPDGARTIAYPCGGSLVTVTKAAGTSFAGAGATAQTLLASPQSTSFVLDINSNNQSLIVASSKNGGATDSTRAYRRSSAGGTFQNSESLVEPEAAINAEGAGLDSSGNAVALVGRFGMQTIGPTDFPVYEQFGSLLDTAPATGGISGPATATTGQLVTFSSTIVNPFGGFTGPATWTSSDGPTGSGQTFDRTYIAPGTYKVTVARTDTTGTTVTANTQIVVSPPPPAQNPPANQPPPAQNPPANQPPMGKPAATVKCTVPKLKGKTLAAAKTALKKAHCGLGKVKQPKTKKGAKKPKLRVSKQTVAAKKVVAQNTKVGLTLKVVKPKKTKRK